METEFETVTDERRVAPATSPKSGRARMKQPVEAPHFYLGIQVPRKETLVKYGLDETAWMKILERQDGKCGACGKVPSSNRYTIDHEHVRGWTKMATSLRPPFVRGLLCYMCNHYRLARGATVANLMGGAQYLLDYEARRLNKVGGVLIIE